MESLGSPGTSYEMLVHGGIACVVFGALLTLHAITETLTLSSGSLLHAHRRALYVQSLVMLEVMGGYALMAAGWTAPFCAVSVFDLSNSAALPQAQRLRWLMRGVTWYTAHLAFMSLCAAFVRMPRRTAHAVMAAHTVNVVTGTAMGFRLLRGHIWPLLHFIMIACSAGAFYRQLAPLRAAALRDPQAREGSRLARYMCYFAIYVCATRLSAGTVYSYLPAAYKSIVAALLDLTSYVLVPLTVVSAELLTDSRRQQRELQEANANRAVAEARDAAKQGFLRYLCHELRVRVSAGSRSEGSRRWLCDSARAEYTSTADTP
jgi:hypothetical protein